MNTNVLSKKLDMAFLPTRIKYAENLTRKLDGPKIFIKRDDLTGIAFGGNKVRKLEYLLFDAIQKKCDCIITVGGLQSNHALQTSIMARMLGLEPYLILEGEEPDTIEGNLLLNKLIKANITFYKSSATLDLNAPLKDLEKKLINNGKKPYPVPLGGSSVIGMLGYVNAMNEIKQQSLEMNINFDYIIVASTSCGTFSGLAFGKNLFNYQVKIIGFNVGLPEEIIYSCLNDLYTKGEELLNCKRPDNDTNIINSDYIGAGYAIPSKECKEGILLASIHEGIFLDPIYSGKAMAGLIGLIRSKKISADKNVLFIHTGGGPSIFPFKNSLLG